MKTKKAKIDWASKMDSFFKEEAASTKRVDSAELFKQGWFTTKQYCEKVDIDRTTARSRLLANSKIEYMKARLDRSGLQTLVFRLKQ
jgi:hypothetical protein